MFDYTDAIYLNGYGGRRIGVGAAYCPVCGEPLNYFAPGSIGECSCGYNTEHETPLQEIEYVIT